MPGVETELTYIARMDARPYYYVSRPPEGEPRVNIVPERHPVQVLDARTLDPAPTLDHEGVQLVRHETAVEDLYDPDSVREAYYREMESLVARVTGASRVVAFDHNVRRSDLGHETTVARNPVPLVHNDYTERSGPQRVRDVLPEDEVERALTGRFAVINVWKPIRGPVERMPLAVCDARSMGPRDFLASDLRYTDRTGEIYSVAHNPAHTWLYFSRMQADEALLLKCYDSARDRARFTAHTAFEDPATPEDAPARESVEVRTMAFFD